AEKVNETQTTATPPTTEARRNSGTAAIGCATPAGVRKIPPPIVEPTSTATALHGPSRRESRSPQRSGTVGAGVDTRREYIGSRLCPFTGRGRAAAYPRV